MNQKKLVTLAVVGLLWMVGLVTAEQSQANDYERRANRETARREVDRHNNRSDWAELGRDRAELRRDQAELERDRADLRRLYRRGASRTEIDRKKAEIRNDLREIGQDRHEIWDDYGSSRSDRAGSWSDNRGRLQRDDQSWWDWSNGWWNSNRDRSYR
jgi:hypothetical protein